MILSKIALTLFLACFQGPAATPPRGADLSTGVVLSTDRNLAEIWYATSKNGFRWEEQGQAIPSPPRP